MFFCPVAASGLCQCFDQYMSSVKYTHMFVDDYVDGGPILPLFAGIIMIHEQGIPFSTLQYSRVIDGFLYTVYLSMRDIQPN